MGHHRDPGGRGGDLGGHGALNLREQVRMVALVVVGIDAVLTVIFLVQGAGGGVIGLALDAFVIWTLVNKKDLFA
jgi:hypothetical protein